jgi:O-antigen/teichoic acid export membrane protein
MSTSSSTSSFLNRLIAHAQTPLYRNGYALVLSSAATSGLGVVYWILAARNYTTEAIGLNSAVLSAMMFVGGVSQLNLVSALNRFVPQTGRATPRIVKYAFLTSSLVALASSLIFVFGVSVWAPALGSLASSPVLGLWFVITTMAWCIFALQDGVLTGLRQATWVPIQNIIFAFVKIILLISFAKLLPQYGVFASWAISLVIAVFLANLLIFRRLIPQHVQAVELEEMPIVPAQIVSYVVGDYVGFLFWIATTTLLPIIITQQAGVSANAYYFLSWTIAHSLYLVSGNMGMSLIAEAVVDHTKLHIYSYKVFIQTARLLVPVVVIMILCAPYILRLFGNNYVTEGTTLLRLLCISTLPNIVTSLYTNIARVQRRMTAVVLVLALLCTLVISLSYVLLGIYGITGVGLAWLLSQTIVAAMLLFTQFGTLITSKIFESMLKYK